MGSLHSFLAKEVKSNQEQRLVVIGLDATGKTTILYKLKTGEVVSTMPTTGFNVETIVHKGLSFTVWDLFAQSKMRTFWHWYYENMSALVFVVDAHDRARIESARDVLHKVLADDRLGEAALLVFANKQDLPNAMRAAEIARVLQLDVCQRNCHVQECCATTGEGLSAGLDWVISVSPKTHEPPRQGTWCCCHANKRKATLLKIDN
ncbi:ADP ribosylation factor 79F-like isoform 1 [Achlya hypogyna]|uniref:ADP ribosylation factor 79F-like isoform 1 n=1 Tax=Achlya hypogyna TaxID=1202772 RepID=A0A1V9ZAI0_ACHHY|nr:ADP ribosylation factor 79F-like isoform 1 [Achlya hypogyna]